MIKCCFPRQLRLYDDNLLPMLATELEKLTASDDEIEFWFNGKGSTEYTSLCLCTAARLRTKYPDKTIKIIRAFASEKDAQECLTYPISTEQTPFYCITDKNILLRSKKSIHTTQWLNNYLIKQSNYIFAHGYPDIDHILLKRLRFASQEAHIVWLNNVETDAFIQEQIVQLDERSQFVLAKIKEGMSHEKIAKALNLSPGRIRSLASEIENKIYWLIPKQNQTALSNSGDICALIGLAPKPTKEQLRIFYNMLAHFVRKGIRNYWLDDISNQHIYKTILEKMAATKKLSIQTFAYSLSNCQDVIQKCQWLLTDDAHKDSQEIKKLCSENEQIIRIDIACNDRQLETVRV